MLFDKNVNLTHRRPQFMRAIFNLAGPIQNQTHNYSDMTDRRDQQDQRIVEMIKDLDQQLKQDFEKDPTGMQVYVVNELWYMELIMIVSSEAFYFAVLSILFVWVYLVVYFKSIFLAVISTFLIVFSFPLSQIFT